MPAPYKLWELNPSYKIGLSDGLRVSRKFGLTGPVNEDEIFAAINSLLPATPYTNIKSWDATEKKTGHWEIEVQYEGQVPESEEDATPPTFNRVISLEGGSATAHITQSKAQRRYGPAGLNDSTVPDMKQVIGVTDDGVEGVDIFVAQHAFGVEYTCGAGWVTDAYLNTALGMQYHTNDAPFILWAAGEVLFKKFGFKRDGKSMNLTYQFEIIKNKPAFDILPVTGIVKKGWEYLWVRYKEKKDTTANRMIKTPIAVYVDKVYDSASFADLQIGT